MNCLCFIYSRAYKVHRHIVSILSSIFFNYLILSFSLTSLRYPLFSLILKTHKTEWIYENVVEKSGKSVVTKGQGHGPGHGTDSMKIQQQSRAGGTWRPLCGIYHGPPVHYI